MDRHQQFMSRCLELAQCGLGTTYPNPLVGCVIVHKDTIIGEGWHRKAGTAHAEVHAIESVKDNSLLRESILYVNLEPCSHFGKTPPCADLIIRFGIPEVVVGATDPNPLVAGKGIERLREAGVNVVQGVLEPESVFVNRRFFTFYQRARPFVVLKWAESADGFIAPQVRDSTRPFWISGKTSQQLVHKWRSEEQAILIGTQTAIDDNPMLTVRKWSGFQPSRILIDKNGRVPHHSHIFDDQTETIVFSDVAAPDLPNAKVFAAGDRSPQELLEKLRELNIVSVMIEGGRVTLQSFIDAKLWDEARIFRCPTLIGSGTSAPRITGRSVSATTVGEDELIIIRP